MAQNVIINGVTYNNVPRVSIPLASGSGNADFVDTTSGDATSADLRRGKKVWVDGNEITGNVETRGAADVEIFGRKVTVPAGVYDDTVEKNMENGNVLPGATVSGDEIGTTETDYEITVTPTATVIGGYVSGNKTGSAVTRYIQVEDRTAVPSTAAVVVTPTAGKLIKKVTIAAVNVGGNATPDDVLLGKTFLSEGSLTLKTGTATVPLVGQDISTKVLTIS